ncbi:MAG: methyltransferase [Phycisphaeraceae bacterium]|nr:methyltransferase [Phycisphaeraceae bacterium]
MNSRERMRRTVEFDKPDRIARDLWTLPIIHLEHSPTDLERFFQRWPVDITGPGTPGVQPRRLKGDAYQVGRYVDEWGCVFHNIQAGVIGEVKEPLLGDWSKMELFRTPDEYLGFDVDAVNAFCRASDKWCMAGCCPRPFERLQFLRGTENLMIDFMEQPAEFKELLGKVHDFHCREIEAWAATDIDAIRFMDDWGSQRSLLISPSQWREIFKPLYRDYVQIAHGKGKKLFMHSDGFIFDVYGDLIEIGIDAINSQLFCMDIEEIARRFGGKITFWGEIDRQHILCFGTVEEARAAVRRVADALYRPEGGLIAQFELGAAAKLDNAHAIYEAWESVTR